LDFLGNDFVCLTQDCQPLGRHLNLAGRCLWRLSAAGRGENGQCGEGEETRHHEPPEQSLEWNEAGVEGMARFLRRLWVQVQKHAASAPASAPDLTALSAEIAKLPRPVLVVSADAGALYLLSRARNPTPYDYVISSELPPGAQEKIVEEIRAGRIQRVLLLPRALWYSPRFVPETLQKRVEEECPHVGDIGPFEVRAGKDGP
jgi:hypothetical protein